VFNFTVEAEQGSLDTVGRLYNFSPFNYINLLKKKYFVFVPKQKGAFWGKNCAKAIL
jgi:hypothetical protein